MIDVDRFEEQLDLALTDELRRAIGLATAPPPTPPGAPAPASRPPRPAKRARSAPAPAAPAPSPPAPGTIPKDIPSLLRAGRMEDADRLIRSQRSVADGRAGTAFDRRDAALWTTMQALRDGRAEDARAGTVLVRALSQEADDRRADDRFWGQRFWLVLDWGDEHERYELLDQCRERAYGHDDVPWRSALTLLCARLGRTDEAVREFDATRARLGDGRLPGAGAEAEADAAGIVTNLAEAAALLGDPGRAAAIQRPLAAIPGPVVFDGHMFVLRGAVARHQALVAAATHQWAEADRAFQVAVDTHRTMGALPLVARTLHEWALPLTGRDDPRAWDYLTESTSIARGLHMTGAIAGMP